MSTAEHRGMIFRMTLLRHVSPPPPRAVCLRHSHPRPLVSFPGGPGHSLKPNSCLSQEFLVKEPAEEEVQAGEEEWRGVVWGWNGPEHQGRQSLGHEPLGRPPRHASPSSVREVGA